MPLKIRAAERGADQAPIATALLLRGKVPADGKINPEAILGVAAYDAKAGHWRATLGPQEQAGPLQLTVQMTTRTGVTASETRAVLLKEPTPPSKVLARITGTVTYGPNPVPNAAVVLADDKGIVKGNAKSGTSGEYAFEKVPPGNYVVVATQSFPALVGEAKVQVPEGRDLVENVAIKMLSK